MKKSMIDGTHNDLPRLHIGNLVISRFDSQVCNELKVWMWISQFEESERYFGTNNFTCQFRALVRAH